MWSSVEAKQNQVAVAQTHGRERGVVSHSGQTQHMPVVQSEGHSRPYCHRRGRSKHSDGFARWNATQLFQTSANALLECDPGLFWHLVSSLHPGSHHGGIALGPPPVPGGIVGPPPALYALRLGT